jgi:hypothetical protein
VCHLSTSQRLFLHTSKVDAQRLTAIVRLRVKDALVGNGQGSDKRRFFVVVLQTTLKHKELAPLLIGLSLTCIIGVIGPMTQVDASLTSVAVL